MIALFTAIVLGATAGLLADRWRRPGRKPLDTVSARALRNIVEVSRQRDPDGTS